MDSAKKAYEQLNGQELDGRRVKLDGATQRDRSNAPGGNNRGGNYGGGNFGGGNFGGRQGGNRNPGNSTVALSQDDKNAKKGSIGGFAGKKIQL